MPASVDMNNNSKSGRHHSVSSAEPRPFKATVSCPSPSSASVCNNSQRLQRSSASPTMTAAAAHSHNNSNANPGTSSAATSAADHASAPLVTTPESPALADLRLTLRAASMQTLVEQCVLSFGKNFLLLTQLAFPNLVVGGSAISIRNRALSWSREKCGGNLSIPVKELPVCPIDRPHPRR